MESLAPITLGVNIGVDLGQKADHTAIVAIELQQRGHALNPGGYPEGGETHYVARLIQRLPLGATYPEVVRRLVELDARLTAEDLAGHGVAGHGAPVFWVDATGVGAPVVDLIRAAGLDLREVYLTGSDQALRGDRREWRIGKSLLVSRLQVLLQTERIHLPNTPDAALLVQELLDYEIRLNDNAHALFGAFHLGAHDDLATALGLAVWEDVTATPTICIPPAPLFKTETGHRTPSSHAR